MKWIDPVPQPEFSWSNHSWGNAIDVKPIQAKAIKKWLKDYKGNNTNHLHISFDISQP